MFEILVLDDHGWVRSVLATMLEDAGFSVRQAASPDEALALAEELSDGAIFITDVNLNDSTDGFEVARMLRDSRPEGLPTLYVTGQPDRFEDHTLLGDERALLKPFTETALITTLGELMPHAYRRADHSAEAASY